MAIVRIYKIAELLGLSSQDTLVLIKAEMSVEITSASSSVDEILARQFVERQARKRGIALPPSAALFTEVVTRPIPEAPVLRPRRLQLTPEVASPAQPADTTGPSSEFDLPSRVHDLVTTIREQVLSQSESLITALSDDHKAALRTAKEALESETKRFDVVVSSERRELEAFGNRATPLLNRLHQFRREADETMARLGLTPRAFTGAATPNEAAPEMPSEDEIEWLTNATRHCCDAKKPGLWPRAEGARWALGAALAAITFATQTPVSLLLWPVGYLLVFWNWKSTQIGLHNQIQELSSRYENAISSLLRRKEAASSAVIGKADEALLVPAKVAHVTAVARADEIRTSSLSKTSQRLSGPVVRIHSEIQNINMRSGFAALPWTSAQWAGWQPDQSPAFAAQIGTLLVQPAQHIQDQLPDLPLQFRLPSLIPFQNGRCLLLEWPPAKKQEAAEALHSAVTRVLATTPAGKARFVFIDPVGLGQNVADFMQLGDHDSALIGGKAWSEPRHIEQQLAELTEHMETVIQKYLRREFQSIFEFNAWAQEVAEPFRFLVIFDFPVNFSPEAARRLVSIARNGARCGVFTLIHRDRTKALPHGLTASDIEGVSNRLVWDDAGVARWEEPVLGIGLVEPDTVREQSQLVAKMMEISGSTAVAAMKVEVPFERLLTADMQAWGLARSGEELTVPLGPCGARKNQQLTLGKGLAHHALIIGRTGSGKTNLMHVIMTGLALRYSPNELELYLVDFKGGVGFKPYASYRIPSARVVAIESDREFGLSVLTGLDATLKERFSQFKAADVDNISDFRARNPGHRMPRIVLVVDEYQEFFSEDDSLTTNARAILERIVRQGRSFGIHIILGSQSLTGSAQLPESILGQMAIRIALPCNQADARNIFAADNGAARSLSRPGEAILNDAGGALEANSPFQVAHFTDVDLIHHLSALRTRPLPDGFSSHIYIFDGHQPAKLDESAPIRGLVASATWSVIKTPRAWLGEAVAMAPSVEASFPARPGRNLLVVTRDEAEGVGVIHAVLTSLLLQLRPTTASFHLLDFSTADETWAAASEQFQESFSQVHRVGRQALAGLLQQLVTIINEHEEVGRVQHRVFVCVIGLHRARDIKPDAEAYHRAQPGSNAAMFAQILRDGPEVGIHVLAWCDSVQSCHRVLNAGVSEFGLLVAGAMAIDDSNTLLAGPYASRLNRPHRMVFVDEEKPGVAVKFRPFSIPDFNWLLGVAREQHSWKRVD